MKPMEPGSAVQAVQGRLAGAAHASLAGHTVSKTRKRLALALAGLADLVQLGFFPVFGEGALSIPDDVLDVVVALALLVTLGLQWRVLVALAIELVPGVALFPTWTAVVLTVPSEEPRKELPPAG